MEIARLSIYAYLIAAVCAFMTALSPLSCPLPRPVIWNISPDSLSISVMSILTVTSRSIFPLAVVTSCWLTISGIAIDAIPCATKDVLTRSITSALAAYLYPWKLFSPFLAIWLHSFMTSINFAANFCIFFPSYKNLSQPIMDWPYFYRCTISPYLSST